MAYSNNRVIAPVSFPDVNQALGTSHTNLRYLCTDSHINKWAKYKPVKLSISDTVSGQWDKDNNTWLSTATWWKGIAQSGARIPTYNCGLVIRNFDNAADFKAAVDAQNVGWTADLPSQPYPARLQDFAEYFNAAPSFFSAFGYPSEVSPSNNFSITMSAQVSSTLYALGLSDIFANSESNKIWYFGVICYSGTTKKGEASSMIPIGQAAQSVSGVTYSWGEIKLKAPAAAGTYTLYPCIFYSSNFTNNPDGDLDSSAVPATQTYIPLPLPMFAPIALEVTSQTAYKEWLSASATFRVYYTDNTYQNIDWTKTILNINVTSTAGSAVASVTRTNTIQMMFVNTIFSGFVAQTETFTYSGTTNNPHSYSVDLTYTAFDGELPVNKRQNMGTAISNAENGAAYIYVTQSGNNNISTPLKVAISVQKYVS